MADDEKKTGSSKGLLKKTAIYAVGNFGSKVLFFLIVPIYSFFILPDDLGYYDLVITSVSILGPLVSLQLADGAYRWLSGANDEEKKKILSSASFLTVSSIVVCLVVYAIFALLFGMRYPVLVALYAVGTVLFPLFQQFTRGLGRTALYAFVGVLYAVCFFVGVCVGLMVFHLDFSVLFAVPALSSALCIVILICRQKELRAGLWGFANLATAKSLLSYSLPLIPNTICWWLISCANRYVLLITLGITANGIFSMSNKFGQILVITASVFYLAWQDTALSEYDSADRDAYFSDVFDKYFRFLFPLAALLVPLSKFAVGLILASSYADAWQYVGLLYVGASFSALCSFLGMGYQISKETARSLPSTVIALAANIVLNIVLAPVIGIQSASVASAVSFALLFTVRVFHTRRYFNLTVQWRSFALCVSAAVASSIVVLANSTVVDIVLTIAAVLLFLVENKNTFHLIFCKKGK